MKATWTKATMACALLALTLACSGEKPAPAASTAPAAPAATVPPATTAPAMTAAVPPAGGSIGVPECDEYVTKYETCLKEHVPAGQRVQMEQAFEMARNGYRTTAANAESRPALANMCKQAMDAAKAATGFYGCKW
jgi:hypothetical protein